MSLKNIDLDKLRYDLSIAYTSYKFNCHDTNDNLLPEIPEYALYYFGSYYREICKLSDEELLSMIPKE